MSKTFLFEAIQFSQKLKWFQVFLCNINNLIKKQSFIYLELNIKIVLHQTI